MNKNISVNENGNTHHSTFLNREFTLENKGIDYGNIEFKECNQKTNNPRIHITPNDLECEYFGCLYYHQKIFLIISKRDLFKLYNNQIHFTTYKDHKTTNKDNLLFLPYMKRLLKGTKLKTRNYFEFKIMIEGLKK